MTQMFTYPLSFGLPCENASGPPFGYQPVAY
jgi:hypothetical protein